MYVSIFGERKKERERGREIGYGGGTCGLMLPGANGEPPNRPSLAPRSMGPNEGY